MSNYMRESNADILRKSRSEIARRQNMTLEDCVNELIASPRRDLQHWKPIDGRRMEP